MRRIVMMLLIAVPAVLGLSSTASAGSATVAMPATDAGRTASAWLSALDGGEDAMRHFLETHVSAEGLKQRPLDARLAGYRRIRDQFGTLTPIAVLDAAEDHVRIRMRAANGDEIAATVLCEPDPPHAMAAVRLEPYEGGEAPAQAGAPMSDEQITAAVGTALDSLTAAQVFSGAVLLVHGDHTLVREARGMADRERRLKNAADTRFNLGSIDKIFTETAIRQLAAQGKLGLGDTIARYLPDYPADKGRRITIQQLLDHRAGTGDVFNDRFAHMDVSRLRSIADWMDLIRDQPLEFEPGTSEAYSNAGYVLLGAIIEHVSGMSYYHYVRTKIFEPAGMTSTGSFAHDENVTDRAVGYTRGAAGEAGAEAGWRPNTDGLPGRGSSAGGGYSTLDDMHRFAAALRGGRLGVDRVGPGDNLGIAGGAPGINATLEMLGDYTLVVMANMDPPAAEAFASRVRRWLPRPRSGGVNAETGGGHAGAGPARRVIRAGGGEDPDRKPARTVSPPSGIRVPMEQSGPLRTVMVRVNGQGPFRFGIDTGGAGTARIDSALAARLGLNAVGEVEAGDPSGRRGRVLPLVHVDSIEVGEARFIGLTAPVRSYAGRGEPVDGILGFGLFADGLVTLDYPAGELRFAPGELPPANGADVLDYTDPRGVPQVPLNVAGIIMPADLDAGSMGGISLPESLATRLKLSSTPRVVGHARTVASSFDVKAAELNGEVRLGGSRFLNPRLEFQPVFPVANIGGRVLRQFRVTFDQRHRRVRLERAVEEPITSGP